MCIDFTSLPKCILSYISTREGDLLVRERMYTATELTMTISRVGGHCCHYKQPCILGSIQETGRSQFCSVGSLVLTTNDATSLAADGFFLQKKKLNINLFAFSLPPVHPKMKRRTRPPCNFSQTAHVLNNNYNNNSNGYAVVVIKK